MLFRSRVCPKMPFRGLDPAKTFKITSRLRLEYFLFILTDADSPMLRLLLVEEMLHSLFEKNRPQPTDHVSVGGDAIDLSPALIRSRRQRSCLDVLPTVLMQFIELAYHQVCRSPVRGKAIS